MILPLFFAYNLTKHLNSAYTNIKTKNAWQLFVHGVIHDVSNIVENLKFVEKLKVYLMCNGGCSNIVSNKQSNRQHESNGTQVDVFGIIMKFCLWDCIVLFIGMILRNSIQIYILWSKSKWNIKILNGSIWIIFL